MDKPFLTYTQQIDKLIFDKKLIVDDRLLAEKFLKETGYFSLICGYKDLFKNKTTKKYKDGVRFEDIVALYKFDENLRELYLKYILKIERHIRELCSYCFVEKYGEQQEEYLNSKNYCAVFSRDLADLHKLIEKMESLATTDVQYPYIKHQREKHGNVPLWVLMNCFTFGMLSKFYSFMPEDLKSRVAKNFRLVNQKQLEQFLTVATKFRNVCAHGERLFSFATKDDIPNMPIHAVLNIPQKGSQYVCGKKDLFALTIILKYLLDPEDFQKFKKSLIKIINNYLKNQSLISKELLFSYMGFPKIWQKIN